MKFAQKLLLAATSGALVLLLAGCPKTPARPDPSSTIVGPTGGGATTSSSNLDGGPLTRSDFGVPTDGLEQRTNGFDPTGQNRSILEAQTVYFDYDQSAIKASERAKLQAAKKYLDEHPTHRLLLEGHCDWRGTAEYNLGLGDRRAGSAKKYLQSIGVDMTRLETLSKGSLEASKNADDATAAKDRRVNLVVIDPALAGSAPMGAPTTGRAM